MTNPSFDPPYPLDGLTPKIRALTYYIQLANQSPLPMCAISALAGCTLAAQGLIKVQWRNAAPSPVGMIFVVEALSGERKTANDQIALEEHRLFDQQQSKLEKQDAKQHALKESVWVAKKKVMLKAIAKNTSKDEETTETEKELEAHEANRPSTPKRPRMLISDITAPAIALHLSEKFPYAGLVSDEGGVILSSGAMSNPAMINSIWDFGSGMTDRIGRGRTEVSDASLTVYLQVQPGVLEQFLSRQGNLTHASGNSSRWLYANPPSTQGTRKSRLIDLPFEDKEVYNGRIREMLSRYAADQLPHPKIKTLNATAKRLIERFSDAIEKELAEGGRFMFMRGAATKAPENCVRLAAVMHEFENSSDEVDTETVRGAIKIVAWHLNQYRLRFAPLTQMELDVHDLEECITKHYHRWEKVKVEGKGEVKDQVKGSELARYAPHRLRHLDKLYPVVQELAIQDKVEILDGETRGWRLRLTHWSANAPRRRAAGEPFVYMNPHPQGRLQEDRQRALKEAAAKRASHQGYELWPGCFLE